MAQHFEASREHHHLRHHHMSRSMLTRELREERHWLRHHPHHAHLHHLHHFLKLHHSLGHEARGLKQHHHHADSAPLIQHEASRLEIHQAIHKAAETFGVSPNLAGGIAYLESIGGNNNAHNHNSLGLFQMQRATSDTVMRRHGGEIATALEATQDNKYAGVIGDLRGKHLPSPAHYNAVILDPYFNSLLGSGLIKDNAHSIGMSGNSVSQIADVYSIHLLGRHVGATDGRTLTQMGVRQDFIDSNRSVLGNAPDPVAADAHKSLASATHQHLANFAANDKALGLYKPEAEPKSAHGKAHVRDAGHHHIHHNKPGMG